MVEMEMREEEEMQIEGLEGLVGSYNDIYADLNSLHMRAKKFQRIGENNRCEGDLDELREKINQLELRQSKVREGLNCELQREHFERKAGWRVSHLHGKLAVVGSLLKKSSKSECLETSIEVEVEALSFWLEEVELLLPQVQWRLASRWSAQRRRAKLARLKMLGEEIESRGRGVSLMTTECQEAKGSPHIKQGNNLVDVLVEKASLLEGRWQAAWLTCLEWQCLLEQLVKVEEVVEVEVEEVEEEALDDEGALPYTSSCLDYHLRDCEGDKSESDSLDEAYSSLSLSDILAARDISTSPGEMMATTKVKNMEGEELDMEVGDNGSDSGVSELSQETTPEPEDLHQVRVRAGKKERLRGRRRREQQSVMQEDEKEKVKEKKKGSVSSFWLVVGFLGVALALWLADHIVCCDSVCAIALSPLLKYTNGPPPL